MAAELRLRAGKLGLTHEDRLKLRIRCTTSGADTDALAAQDPVAVTRLDERRRRLGGGA